MSFLVNILLILIFSAHADGLGEKANNLGRARDQLRQARVAYEEKLAAGIKAGKPLSPEERKAAFKETLGNARDAEKSARASFLNEVRSDRGKSLGQAIQSNYAAHLAAKGKVGAPPVKAKASGGTQPVTAGSGTDPSAGGDAARKKIKIDGEKLPDKIEF